MLEREEMERNELLFIINTYGTRAQQDIAIEELAELQKAILKHRRTKRIVNACTKRYVS